jgi:hypothetical protein
MDAKKKKELKTASAPVSERGKAPGKTVIDVPEPYLRGTVSIARIDRAVRDLREKTFPPEPDLKKKHSHRKSR